jgi:multiple sugar transport system permease protein
MKGEPAVASTAPSPVGALSRHDRWATLLGLQRQPKGPKREDMLWGYLMIAPMFLGLLIFYIWPFLATIYFSFTKSGPFGGSAWEGLANYHDMVADSQVLVALRNTMLYTVMTAAVSIALAILIAVLLNQRIRGVSAYRTLYFLPVVTMPAAVAMIWNWLLNGDYGLVNYIFGGLHVHWVSDPRTSLLAVAAVGIWMSIGYNMIIFLAGLQGIPEPLYEAASIDGAGWLAKFWHVTLPMLTPTTFFVTVISLINGLQVFDLIFMMTGTPPGNPGLESTQSVVYVFFQKAFVENNKGYAASIAVLLFLIIMVVTGVQFRLQKRWVHYA